MLYLYHYFHDSGGISRNCYESLICKTQSEDPKFMISKCLILLMKTKSDVEDLSMPPPKWSYVYIQDLNYIMQI